MCNGLNHPSFWFAINNQVFHPSKIRIRLQKTNTKTNSFAMLVSCFVPFIKPFASDTCLLSGRCGTVQEILIAVNLGLTLILIVYRSLFKAFLEELFFRGFIQGELKTYFRSIYPPVIITNLLFTMAHLQTIEPKLENMESFFLVFVYGVLCSWVRERTGSIVTSTFFHAIINLDPISFLLAYLCQL